MPYFKVETILLHNEDTATLSRWYDNWFNTLDKYCKDKSIAFETLRLISDKYTGGYGTNPKFTEKYYQKMLNCTNRIGGDSAVYKMIEHSLDTYSLSDYELFKLHLFALKICIRSNDTEKLEETVYLFKYMDKEAIMRIKNMLSANENSTKDERFKKWCIETKKKL